MSFNLFNWGDQQNDPTPTVLLTICLCILLLAGAWQAWVHWGKHRAKMDLQKHQGKLLEAIREEVDEQQL